MNSNTILSHFFATQVYRSTFAHLLRELFRLFRWRLAKILLLSFIAAAAQVGALVLIINTVSVLASGGAMELYGFKLAIEPSLGAVLGLASLAVVLLAVATLAMYNSRSRTARMMIDYHSHLDRGVFKGVAALVRLPPDDPRHELLEPTEITSMIGKDGRFAGRVINEVSSSAVPVAAVIIILPILIYLDWKLFSMLAVVIGSSLAVYGWVGRKGANVSIAMEQRGPAASRSKMGVLKVVRNSAPTPESVTELTQELRQNPDVKKFEEAYASRLTMPHMGNAVGSVFLALTSFIVLVYFGNQIIAGSWNQSEGVLFVFLFVYVLISIRNLGKSLTNMNIFYPHLRRIVQFILNTQSLHQDSTSSDHNMSDEQLQETLATLEQELGSRFGFIPSVKDAGFAATRAELAQCLTALTSLTQSQVDALLDRMTLGSYATDTWSGSLYTKALAADSELQPLLSGYPNSPVRTELLRYFNAVQSDKFTASRWEGMSPECQSVIAALALATQPNSVPVIPLSFMTSLSQEEQDFLSSKLTKLTIFYWQKNTSTFATVGVTGVVCLDEDEPKLEPPGNKPRLAKKKAAPKAAPKVDDQDALAIDELY